MREPWTDTFLQLQNPTASFFIDPEKLNDLLDMAVWPKDGRKMGKKIQTAQKSDMLFHASVSLQNGFSVWISLPDPPGDSATASDPLQNLPSFFFLF